MDRGTVNDTGLNAVPSTGWTGKKTINFSRETSHNPLEHRGTIDDENSQPQAREQTGPM